MRRYVTAVSVVCLIMVLTSCGLFVPSVQIAPAQTEAKPTSNLSATASPIPPSSTPIPTFTLVPEPLGSLLPLDANAILKNAGGLKVINEGSVQPVNIPKKLILGKLANSDQLVTTAEDPGGKKVFVFHAYPASMQVSKDTAGIVAGTYSSTDSFARYDLSTGHISYFIPFFSLEYAIAFSYNDASSLSRLTEKSWIAGIPALVLDPADNTWYFWWRDKNGREHRCPALLGPNSTSVELRMFPQFGELMIRTGSYSNDRHLWDTDAKLISLRPPNQVKSIVKIRHLLVYGNNLNPPYGKLGIFEDSWEANSYGGVDLSTRNIHVAAIIVTEPILHGDEYRFNIALPTVSGGTQIAVWFPNTMVGYCPQPWITDATSAHCFVAGIVFPNTIDEMVQLVHTGDAVWFYVTIDSRILPSSTVDTTNTQATRESYCQAAWIDYSPASPLCAESLLLTNTNAANNYTVAQKIAAGEDLSGLSIGPISGLQIGTGQ